MMMIEKGEMTFWKWWIHDFRIDHHSHKIDEENFDEPMMIEKHIKVDYIIHFKGIILIIFDEFLEKGEKLTFHSINELYAILNQKCE